MARARGFAAGRFALELDGVMAGWLMSASGGDAEGEVINEPVGPDQVIRKHIGSVRYSDVELTVGAGLEKQFYQWLANTLAHSFTRKDGSVISVDASLKEVGRLNFFNALISEITFPPLDAASKDPAKLTVTVAPEYARRVKGSGAKLTAPGAKAQKNWLASNFRLTIDGVDCTHVTTVEPITVTQKVGTGSVGEVRIPQETAQVEIGDLVVTFPVSHSTDFVSWHDEFVVKGKSGPEAEKTGTLQFLTPNRQEVLFTLTFAGLGIFKLEHEKHDAAADTVAKMRASIYCEELTFAAA